MNNKCQTSRNIFNFLKILNCDECKNKLEDEIFYIGRRVFNIYYLKQCNEIDINDEILFMFSKKLIILLKDAYYNNESIVFMIIERNEFEFNFTNNKKYGINFMDVFQAFLDINLDIQLVLL